jgi:transcriptional regulator with XRE-family HTH domain
MPINIKTFARNIVFLREKKRFTQEDAAQQLNVQVKRLQNWENGTAYPKMSKLVELVEFLNYEDIYTLLTKDITKPSKSAMYANR